MVPHLGKRYIKSLLHRVPEGSFKRKIYSKIFQLTNSQPREGLISRGDNAVMVGSPNAHRIPFYNELTGGEGEVLFIEPEPTNHERLLSAATGYDNVYVDKRGAWSASGEQSLLLGAEDFPGDNKIEVPEIEHDNDLRTENYNHSVKIEVEPLDTIVQDYSISPDYIEIMVNGAELEVLEGAREILEENAPKLLVKGHARDSETGEPINTDIASYLAKFGYCTRIGPGGEESVIRTDEWSNRDGDVYAWRPDR